MGFYSKIITKDFHEFIPAFDESTTLINACLMICSVAQKLFTVFKCKYSTDKSRYFNKGKLVRKTVTFIFFLNFFLYPNKKVNKSNLFFF